MAPASQVNTGDCLLDSKIKEYLQWNKDVEAEKEIIELIKKNDVKTLSNLFLKRLEFGTAGLRGRMGAGYSQMNDLVIIQTGQGFVKYLLQTVIDLKETGIIIGYDGRHHSKKFAELTAAIFINNGIKVYMYSNVCPTPFVPFGILKYNCSAGVMVTASHNPKEDNGYKVYGKNGAQIIPPHDKGIQKSILDNLEPLKSSWDTFNIYNSPLLKDPLPEVIDSYFSIVKDETIYPEINKNTILKFTYTAMHGVGYPYMVEAFNAANFKPFIPVEEQKDPDPDFPTVKFPNPEEGKSALDLSFKTADKNGSTIILANDPDADRLACAVRKQTGDWYVFTGNELGALLGWWMIHAHQVRNPTADLSNAYMLASTVSSKILASMAKKDGFKFEETLTGFKWMGNKCIELKKQGKDVLFAYEEAIGFMCGSTVPDKDGISAGTRVAEMAAYLETMGLTLVDKLEEIYTHYGRHITDNSYWICHEQETIKNIFERLRNYDGKPNTINGYAFDLFDIIATSIVCYFGYSSCKIFIFSFTILRRNTGFIYPTSIGGGKYPIISVRDLTTGYDNTKINNKAVLPVSKNSQMITFTFSNGLVTTLRTSGTEPKIKYYNELCASPELQNVDALRKILGEMVLAIVDEFLRPEKNGLIPRTS